MAFAVEIMPSALEELQAIKVYHRRQIATAIEAQLFYEPSVSTRHRKPLDVAEAPFEFEPPLWELRIGDFRVFYDVDEPTKTVHVRAIREKPPHATTEEVL